MPTLANSGGNAPDNAICKVPTAVVPTPDEMPWVQQSGSNSTESPQRSTKLATTNTNRVASRGRGRGQPRTVGGQQPGGAVDTKGFSMEELYRKAGARPKTVITPPTTTTPKKHVVQKMTDGSAVGSAVGSGRLVAGVDATASEQDGHCPRDKKQDGVATSTTTYQRTVVVSSSRRGVGARPKIDTSAIDRQKVREQLTKDFDVECFKTVTLERDFDQAFERAVNVYGRTTVTAEPIEELLHRHLALKIFVLLERQDEKARKSKEDCVICLVSVDSPARNKMRACPAFDKCKAQYHIECIKEWLAVKVATPTASGDKLIRCPCCQNPWPGLQYNNNNNGKPLSSKSK